VRVFELDRAELLALKARRLGATPANITRVPIDFLRDALETRLLDTDFDTSRPTVFLWEGVTNYLDQAAVDAVFDTVSRFKARIIFTYVHADAVNGAFNSPGLTLLLARLKRIGEPWTFGFKPEEVPAYLQRHSMKRIADLGAAEYRALYDRVSEGYEFYRVALAAPL
jgi:methyltransferase (TIGR00027 family)